MISILPFYIQLMLQGNSSSLTVLRVLRLARIFRSPFIPLTYTYLPRLLTERTELSTAPLTLAAFALR